MGRRSWITTSTTQVATLVACRIALPVSVVPTSVVPISGTTSAVLKTAETH